MTTIVQYIYGIADNTLILGQRLGELCGHGPSLETDIAMTNIALDLLGQTRSYYQYAAKILGGDATEDSLAFKRNEREYRNVLLVEHDSTLERKGLLARSHDAAMNRVAAPRIEERKQRSIPHLFLLLLIPPDELRVAARLFLHDPRNAAAGRDKAVDTTAEGALVGPIRVRELHLLPRV